jgi:hypothetical protein
MKCQKTKYLAGASLHPTKDIPQADKNSSPNGISHSRNNAEEKAALRERTGTPTHGSNHLLVRKVQL